MSALKVARDLAIEAGKSFSSPYDLVAWLLPRDPQLAAQALLACCDPAEHVGSNVIVKTVGEIIVGTMIAADGATLMLYPAVWAADTGRWNQCLLEGTLQEVEPYCDPVLVSRGAIVAWTAWRHAVPTDVR